MSKHEDELTDPITKNKYIAILGYDGHIYCSKCNMPMMHDVDHIRCCGIDCELRGKKFKKPILILEELK